jgi:adenylate kinase family enzyme
MADNAGLERAAQSWQADAMRAFLITGNPGTGKSTLAAELSRRGQTAIDADDLASWEDSSGMPVDPPARVDEAWQLAHRWVWNRARIEEVIASSDHRNEVVFVCGIARNQDQMLDLFERVFLLVIEADAQDARLARATSPQRTEGIKKQIREGRPVFQAKALADGAIPLDATASPADLADMVLAVAHTHRQENP